MRFLILLILSFQYGRADKNIVPVFLIDNSRVMPYITNQANPFAKISSAFFTEIIHYSIKRSAVVIIFVEETFSVEDVSIKDKLGTPYHHLQQGLSENKVTYLPAVMDPFKMLNSIFQPQQFNVFYLSSATKLQMFDGHFKYYYIYFQDGKNGTRAEILRKHDLIMRQVYFVVRQLAPGPVVAFYTGKMNPVEIDKVAFVPISPRSLPVDPGVFVATDGALFRLVGVFAATPTRRAMFNQKPMVAEETWTDKTLSTKMAYTDFELEFSFSFKNRDWLLDHVALLEGGEEVGRTDMAVGAPWNWAYYCGEPLVVSNNRDGSTVTISEYQIQPLKKRALRDDQHTSTTPYGGGGGGKGNDTEGESGFGNTLNCSPYMTVKILAGLFVTAIFIGILLFGVIAMKDIRTYDRYEDPQGKPLVINAEGGGK
ncbi:hypothetical protein ABMA27_012753 [Loxostege sticticalis]|uniref:V-type proton ATPase subunit S1/VOA1 transmembrane domain-containing protein n=1 Tax=Loxostege sticticalis TaxID=481309 RepID=A0ABR3GZS2_LOXSC